MALPKQKITLYELTVPSTKKKVKFRPYLVKEEKALLLAEQSDDIDVMIQTLKSVISSCTEDLDPESLAIFDLEYILTVLKSKSVGEISEINVPCESCDKQTGIQVDLSKVYIEYNKEHDKKIPLFDDVGIVMKYPKIDILQSIINTENDIELTFESTMDCIDFIYDSEAVYYAVDTSREELEEFLDNLTEQQFDKIENFFKTMPKVVLQLDFACQHCNHHNHRKVEGIRNFI